MKRQALTFSGRVQGVGFRATTRSIARGYEVSGWVRNEPDGTVRCEVQGPDAACEAFVAAVRDRLGRYIVSVHAEQMRAGEEDKEQGFVIRR